MKIHIVQKGDTLWDIAQKYAVDFEELQEVNPQLASPDMIMPGMKIKVPTAMKNVKKEVPIKEVKKETPIKEQPKELQKSMPPKKPVIEADDKGKKMAVKPEKPLPMMPETPKMPEYSMMQMPKIELDMQQDTVINVPPMTQPETTKPKKEKQPEQPKKMEETIETKYSIPPEIPQHLHTSEPEVEHKPIPDMPPPMPQMHPVCYYVVPPCYTMFPTCVIEGQMSQGYPMPEFMPQATPYDDCGCGGPAPDPMSLQGFYEAPPYPFGEMMEQQRPVDQPFPIENEQQYPVNQTVPIENRQQGFHNPDPFQNNTSKQIEYYPPVPPQNTTDFYPAPPSFSHDEGDS